MEYKREISKIIFDYFSNKEITEEKIYKSLEVPPNQDLGNYSLPCFFLSKLLKKSPVVIAKDLAGSLRSKDFEFFEVNGYLNIKINSFLLFKNTISDILNLKENFTKRNIDSRTYVIDTFNPNPLKTLHVGHIRNAVTGQVVYNLLKEIGANPKAVTYNGDVGTHVSKWLWYYYKFLEKNKKEIPKSYVSKWFGEIYISAGNKVAENPDIYKKEIDDLQVKLMTDESLQKDLKKFVTASFNSFLEVGKELGITVDHTIFESQAEKKFLEIKTDLFKKYKDIFVEDDGAIVADLGSKELGNFILIKGNGALLYGAKDIGLINLKKEKYPDCNDFLYVVACEQDFYLKQLFRLFKFICPNFNNLHISHGLINTPEGKMKSREGGMTLYEDFRDEVFTKVNKVLTENGLDSDQSTLKKISFGTIIFEMLKINTSKNLVFDLDVATDLAGDSCSYVQYTGVRAKGILEKANLSNISLKDLSKATLENEELLLINKFQELQEKIEYSARNYKPHIIANYALELAHLFNKFYTTCQVLVEDEAIKKNRVLIIKAYIIVLTKTLSILGIEMPEKM